MLLGSVLLLKNQFGSGHAELAVIGLRKEGGIRTCPDHQPADQETSPYPRVNPIA